MFLGTAIGVRPQMVALYTRQHGAAVQRCWRNCRAAYDQGDIGSSRCNAGKPRAALNAGMGEEEACRSLSAVTASRQRTLGGHRPLHFAVPVIWAGKSILPLICGPKPVAAGQGTTTILGLSRVPQRLPGGLLVVSVHPGTS